MTEPLPEPKLSKRNSFEKTADSLTKLKKQDSFQDKLVKTGSFI
jgi:hypothetical protein